MDFENLETVWERLTRETRPVVLYGMGNGADKIRTALAHYGVKISAVFASDGFVRGHSYAGFPVQKLSEVTAAFGEDIVVLIAFASSRPEVLEQMYALDKRFDVFAPDVPVTGEHLFDRAFARLHAKELQSAYDSLGDMQSRRVFADTVAYKLTGRLAFLRGCETAREEAFATVLHPCEQEHFVDLGAYTGDTIRELLTYTNGRYASITALEPDRKNYRKLCRYLEDTLHGSVKALHAGAWDENTLLRFAAKAGRQSALSKEGELIDARTVDSVLEGKPCTLLKLDVEGAERRALLGARRTITQYRPRLNIAAYHRSEDLYDLPLLIRSLCPDYRLFLRRHPYVPAWDLNLYAAP